MNQELRNLLRAMPKGTLIPVESLTNWLECLKAEGRESIPPIDHTVREVAELLDRSSSTIRGWLAGGEIPEAYKLQGREWRIPRSALVNFMYQQRAAADQNDTPEPAVSLSAWRKHMDEDAA